MSCVVLKGPLFGGPVHPLPCATVTCYCSTSWLLVQPDFSCFLADSRRCETGKDPQLGISGGGGPTVSTPSLFLCA